MYFSSILALFLSTSLLPSVSAGQGFTQGLSIINAPSPGSPGHAGSPLPISVEVSGNGNLPEDSSFELLEIYLVSSDTEINMTVAQGTGFLTGETGSVRHLNWPVPQCTPPGDYNLTFYETTRIAGDVFFVITAVPLPVENPNPSGDCTADANTLEPQPQPFNPPDDPPLAGTPETMMTVTMPAGPFPTVTETSGSTVTVIMESITTVTTMQMGSNGPTTSTFTQTFWSTTAMDAASISGLVPLLNVDAGGADMNVVSGSLKWITLASLIYAMMN